MAKVVSKRQLRRQIQCAVDRDLESVQKKQQAKVPRLTENLRTKSTKLEVCLQEVEDLASGCTERVSDLEDWIQSPPECNQYQKTVELFDLNAKDTEPDAKTASMHDQLKSWALEENVSHSAIGKLLHVLHDHFPELPLSSRTLLRTKRRSITTKIPGGELLYLGIKQGLMKKIKAGTRTDTTRLSLRFGIDGIPLFNDSNLTFWPILCLVNESTDHRPFPIAVFCGNSKPKCLLSYLNDFVLEFKGLLENGFDCNGQNYILDMKKCTFILDAPARAFVKSVKGHMGYYACEKCITTGVYNCHRMTFPQHDAPPRTDESFDMRVQDEHHNEPFLSEKSPLEKIGVGMVSQFPLEYMHLVCLGTVRKIPMIWIKGPLKTRLQSSAVMQINSKLQLCIPYIPVEFNRKPRLLEMCERWKATEARQFLLYTGPVVLRNTLKKTVYDNFMLLSIGIRLLLSTKSCNYLYAEELLVTFVKHFKKLYGEVNMSYNIHNLVHLANESKLYGSLDNISAFPMENALGIMKRLIRSKHHPLQQLDRRIEEREILSNADSCCEMGVPNKIGVVKVNNCTLTSSHPNCYIMVQNQEFYRITKVTITNGIPLLQCHEIKPYTDKNLFDYPFESTQIQIVLYDFSRICNVLKEVKISSAVTKMICLPHGSFYALIPLCHAVT